MFTLYLYLSRMYANDAIPAEDSVVVAVGGWGAGYQRQNSAEFLRLPAAWSGRGSADETPVPLPWAPLPPMMAARVGPAVTTTATGAIFVAGGAGETSGGSAEIYESWGASAAEMACAPPGAAVGGGWRALAPMPAGERSGARACLVDKGQGSLPMVLVIGGLGERGRAIVSTVEAYTFSTQAAGQDLGEGGGWSLRAPMHTARVNFAATTLPGGGRVLVAGGEVKAANPGASTITQSVEVYDVTTDAWSVLQSHNGGLGVERYGCGAACLADGAVVIAGGYGGQDRRGPPRESQGPLFVQSFPSSGTVATGAGAVAAKSGQFAVGGFASGSTALLPSAFDTAGSAPAPSLSAAKVASVTGDTAKVQQGRGEDVASSTVATTPRQQRAALLASLPRLGCACCAQFTAESASAAGTGGGRCV